MAGKWYSEKLSAIVEGKRKTVIDTNILKELMSMRPPIQRILEAILKAEDVYKCGRETTDRKQMQ